MTVVMWGKAAHPAQSAMQEAPILKSPIKTLSWSGPTETPGTREMMALFAFDSLEPGDHIVLAFDAAPRGFLAHFQAERKGQFDWTPVRQGPETWAFEVSRRKAERGELRTVNEALSWDHDRLDALEGAAFEARAQGRFTEAAVIYAAFAYGLRRHIRFEEEILFPEFEEKTGHAATAGPTMVMRDEHREILDCLDRIQASIADPASGVDSVRHALHLVLGNHNLKEENIVYPMTDRALGVEGADALVARIQAL
jgi:uncharacterized protein (DUF2249 family)/hemerythrin-like domain-containing protein